MKIFKRILLGVLVLLVLFIVAGYAFIRHISRRALPDYNKNIQLTGLHAPVDVYRDSFAIPHVYASDEHDLYMAVGYLMAEDRLWQMDLLRHVTEGRLSAIFGKDYTDTDLLLRALRFGEKSERILAQADTSTLNTIQAFAEGINQYIRNNTDRLPPEFALLRYEPEPWKPVHTLNMIGYMAWDLKAGWSELLLTDIQKVVDSVHYHQLLPDITGTRQIVFPDNVRQSSTSGLMPDMLLHLASLRDLGVDILEASNNWAVSGSKSNTGMPLLANDMHLGLSVPGIWYQMHQVIEGKLNVTGLVLPGTPAVICGHNDSIAWGMTNTYVDNVDFYEEKINPDDSNQYKYNGSWRNFEVRKVVIKNNDGEQVERTLRFSHRGPVVSSFKKMADRVVTMHWVGDEASDEYRTVMLLNRANNWLDFTEALKTFKSTSQNIVYADRRGNIGLFCAAGIPMRKHDIPFGILPGETDEYDWKGYVPFDQLPYLFNPANGFVASANNRTAPPDYPYHIGTFYEPSYRFERITEQLSALEKLSVDDFVVIQLDQYSKMAEKYLPSMLDALKDYRSMNQAENRAFEILQAWDFRMESTSAAAALFEVMFIRFMNCTLSDELGEGLFDSFIGVNNISRIVTDQFLERKVSVWFDDLATENQEEGYNDMVICAFTKAMAYLGSQQGNNPDTWEWGKLHQLVLAHPLSKVKILDRAFNLSRGPSPVGGSFHTVSKYQYDNKNPFEANFGSSHRHIFDLSDWNNSLTVIPTGNSGIPASRHYCDQTDMYIQGKYHANYFSKEKVLQHAKYHMEFY